MLFTEKKNVIVVCFYYLDYNYDLVKYQFTNQDTQ